MAPAFGPELFFCPGITGRQLGISELRRVGNPAHDNCAQPRGGGRVKRAADRSAELQ